MNTAHRSPLTDITAPTAVIILAAGKGTRMKSAMPKVLHPIAGVPMLHHTIQAARNLNPARIVVVTGFEAAMVETDVTTSFPDLPITFARQTEQNGTGHAVLQAAESLKDFTGTILIFSGDSTLPARPDVLPALMQEHAGHDLTILTADVKDPTGYGRVFHKKGQLVVVEQKDCNEAEQQVTTVNTSFYAVESTTLWSLLAKLQPNNAQKEYYLTDIVALGGAAGLRIGMVSIPMEREEIGMNNRAEIAQMETLWQNRKRLEMMLNGVTLLDPATVYFAPDTRIEPDVVIHQNVVFGPAVTIKTGATILPFCHLEGCVIHGGSNIGPFARVRPTTEVGPNAKVGNFVELKNTTLGEKASAGHLTYLGDATVGHHTNIGAGTITANYNHKTHAKAKTTIGNNASTGSNTVLVAPVTLADGAYTGASTVIRKSLPEDTLAFSAPEVLTKSNYSKK